jgi:hypothetical protein
MALEAISNASARVIDLLPNNRFQRHPDRIGEF